MKKILSILLALLALTACTKTDQDSDGKLHIYTSVYPLQFIAESLLGEHATVSSVYPPGVDAHTYEPAARDITAIAKADDFFYVGGHMESFTDTIAQTVAGHPVTLHSLIDEEAIFIKNDKGDIDPHLWLDPARMILVAEWMKEILTKEHPELKDHVEKSYLSLKKELTRLDGALTKLTSAKDMQPLLVVHGAYNYWTERYGIQQIAIHGMMAGEESSQKKLAAIVRLAEKYQIHYVIYEPNNDDKVANIITDYLGAEKVIIHDLEVLTDADVRNGDNYLSLMKRNITVLEKVLQREDGIKHE